MIVPNSVLLMLVLGLPTVNPGTGALAWKTGTRFEQQLISPVGIEWVGPLRQGLASLSRSQHICIMLDRRVDPSQELSVSMPQIALRQCLDQIAQEVQAESCYIGPVVYIARPDIARVLPTLAAIKRQEARNVGAELRKRLFHRRAWQWHDLTTPRDLLAELADELQIRMEGIEMIPHDLWPAAELPPISCVDRLSIVTAGFSRSFEFDGDETSIRIIPLPETVELTRIYRGTPARKRLKETLRNKLPHVKFDFQKSPWVATGSWEDHRMISRFRAGMPDRSMPAPVASDPLNGELSAYSLKIEDSIKRLLEAVTPRLGLELKVDPRITKELQVRVRVEVNKVSAEELLHAILDPVNLRFQIQGRRLEVLPIQEKT